MHDNTKFGNDLSALSEEDTYGIKKSSPKEENLLKRGIS